MMSRRVHDEIGGIETPCMGGDNLAVTICSYFNDPDQHEDDETGWGKTATNAWEEVEKAIQDHYEPTISQLEAQLEALKKAAQAVVVFFNGEVTCVNELEKALLGDK